MPATYPSGEQLAPLALSRCTSQGGDGTVLEQLVERREANLGDRAPFAPHRGACRP